MRRLSSPLLVLAVIAISAISEPSRASAARVKECGTAGTLYSGDVKLTNVTSRNVACFKARRFARRFTLHAGEETGYRCDEDFYCDWRGWHCRNDGRRQGYMDHRCERPTPDRTYVVRWQVR